MIIRTFAIILFVGVALVACDQNSGKHEIVHAGNQTFLLNKVTGETKVIIGTSLFTVKEPLPTTSGDAYKKAKIWPEQAINDLKGASCKTPARQVPNSGPGLAEAIF